MLKKTLSIAALTALLLTLSVPLTRDASAYKDVCVRFEFPKAWYSGRFRVEYGEPDKLWGAYSLNARLSTNKSSVYYWEGAGHLTRARGRTPWSRVINTSEHYCMPMDDVRDGEYFTVLLRSEEAESVTLRYCRTWPQKPGKPLVFEQKKSDKRRLMVKAWGIVTKPECAAEWARVK